MKNAFVLSSLVLTVAYPVALAAEMIGVVSFRLPSFPMVVGAYAAVGVLTFAFRDYTRLSASRATDRVSSAPRVASRPALHALSLANSTLHSS